VWDISFYQYNNFDFWWEQSQKCISSIAPMDLLKWGPIPTIIFNLDGFSKKLKYGGLTISFANKRKLSKTSPNFF
jgi:hypothetical protein